MNAKLLAQDAQTFAVEAVKLLTRIQKDATVAVDKGNLDFATTADLEAEKQIIDAISKKYPSHGILTEETGEIPGHSPYTWIIDPLDGTKEYARGSEDFCTLIAVEEHDKLIAGCAAMYPDSLVRLVSAKGDGSWCNDTPVKCSDIDELRKASISVHLPYDQNPDHIIDAMYAFAHDLVKKTHRVRANHNEAKVMGWVGRGIMEAHIIPPGNPKWWDIAPLILFIEEAGGKVTDLYGNPVRERNLDHGIIASNGHIHDTIVGYTEKYFSE